MCPKKLNSVTYKKSMLDSAVEAVMSGTFTMKQSASVYGVPVASISNTLKKKGYSSKKKKDIDQLAQIDKQLMDWLQLMAEISCFSLRNQIADIINEVFERFGQKVKLDGKSGQMQWIDRFGERQPEVFKASLEAESVVTGISSEHIDEWTRKLRSHFLHAHNIEVQEFSQQSNAGNIFCCFEVGSVYFSGNKRSFRLLYKPSQGQVEGDFIMSLYSCICADGTFLKPVAIVKDETLIQTTMETGVRDFHILSSSEGKMSCEAAMLWMQLIDVEIQPKKGHTSFLIFLDQTIRPLSLATLDFCRQRELILFYLPGHYPNMKLPFGMDIFYNLNGEYDSILSSDDAREGEGTVESALELLMEAWKMMLKTNSNVTEFHDFGLVPLDSSVMKSTVEEIVPLTMSPTEGALEAQDGAETPASSAHVPNTPSTDASSSCLPSASQQSNDNIAVNLPPVRPSRIPPKNYKETSETDNETEETVEGSSVHTGMTVPTSENVIHGHSASSKKPNLKIKIKRSERTPNNFSVEPDAVLPSTHSDNGDDDGVSGRKSSSENPASCDQCDKARDHGLRSGVVQGLVFALKRIESSLRADTLNLYKSRYLSPYLNDHRPSEPSFVMWCELMKCLEMGPDAVQKDFLLARSIQNNSCLKAHSSDCGSTNLCKSGNCPSDATSDASVLPHRISKNKKRTRSPGLQESETLGILPQNVFTRNNTSSFPNTGSGNISALKNMNDLSKPKTNKHEIYSTQAEQRQGIANGQSHGVSEREIVDFNNNDHLNNAVHYPYKAYTQTANIDMQIQGRESFGSLHSGTQFSCNNQQEPLDSHSASAYREGMLTLGHKGIQEQKLEPHSLRPQFRPPRNVPSQAIPSPHQRPQFDKGSTIFHQHSQLSTSAGLSMQHQQFQRSQQSQQDSYPLLTKTGQTQPQKVWHPSQPNESQEPYASSSQQQQQQEQQQQQRIYQQLHHQERRDSSNASMQSKYDYQTDSSGVSSMAVPSENSAHTSQRTRDTSQDIIIDEPAALPCKSKMTGNRSVQQSCTPKKNTTSPHVTSTPKSADGQMSHITPTSAPQVHRPQSIESSQQGFVNNLNGTGNTDGGTAHFQANLQQHNRPLPSQYEIENHPVVSNNQTVFSYSRPAHPSRTAAMPPPINLSSAAHNLTEDGSSHMFIRGSEEQKHQTPGLRQENVPRYQTHLSGIQGGDFNRSSYYPFSGHIQPSSSSQGSSHHTFAPNSYGSNASQTLSSYNQTMPQTGGYSNGFQPNSNEQSHPSDFHSAYQFSGLQQHQPQHHQHQQHPQIQHMQQQPQQQQLSQSQQHQHMQNSSNGSHMSAAGHAAPLLASRAIDGGHTASDVKIEQYTNL